jgi:Aerotolerance regulator N-terminal
VLSFVTPAWLLGLLLVPVIRWLHLGGPQRRAVPVASLALWRKAEATGPAAGGRRPPDPAWRRRALIAVLLSLALAGPRSAVDVDQVTLWVDDSLSMLTREDGVLRLTRGLELAAVALEGRPDAAVEVRSLSRPWEVHRELDAQAIAELVAAAGQQEPARPPAALWSSDREHWLVTDGAADSLDARDFSRVIRVGETRRNVGLLRLAARRSLEDRDRIDVELQARNGGDATEERVVVLAGDGGVIARSTLRLAPGESATVSATTGTSSRLTGSLEPGDALEADDSISLEAAELAAKRVRVDPSCPTSLLAALRSHPALALAGDAADAALSVSCGATVAPGSQPVIYFRRGESPRAAGEPLLWSSAVDSSSRRLGAYAWRTTGRLAPPRDGDVVLLASGATPLVMRRAAGAATVIETSLDVEPDAGDDPASTPLLVAFLVDEALSTSLLDPVAVIERSPDAVMVVPRAVANAAAEAPATTAASSSRSWSRPLLFAALLALLLEFVTLLRRLGRERTEAEAWSR